MSVIGWLVDEPQRPTLLERFPPVYRQVVAHHITLQSGVPEDEPLPREVTAVIIGEADDGQGVQALVVEIDGSTDARESNDVIRDHGWIPREPTPVKLTPGRF